MGFGVNQRIALIQIKMPESDAIDWYVLRAYKAEKGTEEWLQRHKKCYFIPKRWQVREYHGRKGRYLVPAIPSLVFVKTTIEDLKTLKRQLPRLQFVMDVTAASPKPLTVPMSQMDSFIAVASRAADIDNIEFILPDEAMPSAGAKVRIIGGAFDGVTGIFRRVKGHRNRRLVVELPGVGAVTAEVRPDLLEVIK